MVLINPCEIKIKYFLDYIYHEVLSYLIRFPIIHSTTYIITYLKTRAPFSVQRQRSARLIRYIIRFLVMYIAIYLFMYIIQGLIMKPPPQERGLIYAPS